MSRSAFLFALAALLLAASGGWTRADPAISMTNPVAGTLGSDSLNYNNWLANRIYLGEDAPLQRPDTVTLTMNVTYATPLMSVFIYEDVGGRPVADQLLALFPPTSASLAVSSGTNNVQLVFKMADTSAAVFTPGKHYWLAVGVTGINDDASPGQQLGLLDWSYASSTVSTSNGWQVDPWIAVSNTNGAEWSSSPGLPYIFNMTTVIVPEPSRAVLMLFGMMALALRRCRPLAVAALPLLSTGCSKPPAPPDDGLAKVGAEVITADDFKAAAVRRGGGDPASVDRKALLEELINESALVQRAKARGLDQTPDFQRRVRTLLIATLRETESAAPARAVAPTQSDLMGLYEKMKPGFTVPAARRLAILQLTAETPASESLKAAAEKLKQAAARFHTLPPDPLRRGFGQIAAEFSDDQDTRYIGGDLGWLTDAEIKRRLPAAVASAALALTQPGTSSEATISGNAVFVLLLSGQRAAAVQPFEKVEKQLRQEFAALSAKKSEAEQQASLRQGLDIQINEEKLRAVTLDSRAPAVPSVPANAP
ncbi:choice-of-anchor R domain-containing protein [Prosthecobacter sp.]|uniref:choice-of-anchor R domain-containing protein n=1 Tax=Prosthecobacter sp. TaxID=1965333 RepID=UPI0037844B8A